ncbi:uncharacterized protein Triagg1_7972 [Trichoderma aggressivum f. europaeum]|uniref:Uncharacterized protein n=1 Tax=Trichoderma aggressivum f. europaeum TaxID=173218 RepID=A0AAE1M2A8_9HYPO|nr:hypothetical protein Triagg1_7972 [Trichoderma aggressivum f. europaeum]
MGRLQDVTRFLLAAGGSASADGKSTHLFHEEKNALFMETWTGSELTNRQQVVTGVRTDTAAPLVSLHYNRVFVVDQTHALRCFTETEKAENEHDSDDEEEEEDTVWEDEELDGLDIKVHDKSQLAVACGKITIVVFYQNADGTIGAIEDDGHHGWKIAQLPHSEALPGTPMASFQAKDAVYFVYVAADQTFRYLEHSNDEWKDAPFSSAKIEGATAKISLAEDEKAETDPKLLIFCLADNKLSTIKPGSTEAETWGTVEDGVYKPTSDQENNGSPQGSIPIPFHPGSLFIYSSGPPPPPPPPVVPAFFPVASPFACYEDFGQLSLRDDAQYQQPLYRPQPPPPYEYAYGRFNDRYYESQDEPMLRQSTQRPDARSGPQPHYDPSWQGSYQHPYRARDMYQQDPYQRDPYYQDRYPQDYYQRDPYQRDPNQPPPQDFSRQQNLPQELQRQQQGPLQESSRQQQQQQPPLQELQRRQQPPLQETQRQQQPPVQEIQRRQEPVHRAPTVEDGEEEDDDDDSPPQSQPPPPPPPQPQPQTQRQPAPVPNAEETQQRRQQQQQQQQPQQHLPPSPTIKTEDDPEAFRRHRPLMQDRHARGIWPEETTKTNSSSISGVTAEKHLSVIVKMNFGVLLVRNYLSVTVKKKNSGVLVKKNFGLLAKKKAFGVLIKKSIPVLVGLPLNIVVSTMSLTIPI